MSEQSDRAAAYRAKAAELRKYATSSVSDEIRRGSLSLGDQWDQLAEQLESVGRFGKKDG